jgi:hypothetical protein
MVWDHLLICSNQMLIKFDQLKMLTAAKPSRLSFVESLACHLFPPVLAKYDMCSPLLFPSHPQTLVAAAQNIN